VFGQGQPQPKLAATGNSQAYGGDQWRPLAVSPDCRRTVMPSSHTSHCNPTGSTAAGQEADVNPGDLVLRRCQEVVDDPSLGWDDNLYEAGMDSISLLELSDLMATDTGICVQLNELFNCVTPTDVAALFQAQGAARD
jgi:acyl carrier protein